MVQGVDGAPHAAEPCGDPVLFYLHGADELPRHQGFAWGKTLAEDAVNALRGINKSCDSIRPQSFLLCSMVQALMALPHAAVPCGDPVLFYLHGADELPWRQGFAWGKTLAEDAVNALRGINKSCGSIRPRVSCSAPWSRR